MRNLCPFVIFVLRDLGVRAIGPLKWLLGIAVGVAVIVIASIYTLWFVITIGTVIVCVGANAYINLQWEQFEQFNERMNEQLWQQMLRG
jgi:hypothetical protein